MMWGSETKRGGGDEKMEGRQRDVGEETTQVSMYSLEVGGKRTTTWYTHF